MARKKSKINFVHLLLSLLFILLIGGGGIYFARTYKPPTAEEYIARGETYLEGLQSELSVTGTLQETMYWDWIDENNKLLPLTGKQFLLGTTDTDDIGKYGKISSKNLTKINNKFFAPLLITSSDYYEQSKFVENEMNQRKNMRDELNETFRGFEKNKIKCMIRLTPQSDPYGYFFCGTIDEKQIKLQKQLSSLFSTTYNPKKYYSYRIEKINEPFARGSVSESVEGYVFIAKKTDGRWKIIWKGNEIALCSEMERLSIPKSIYESCYKDN